MEDLPLGRISALVSEFAVKDLPMGRTHDDDDDDDKRLLDSYLKIALIKIIKKSNKKDKNVGKLLFKIKNDWEKKISEGFNERNV